MSLTPADRDENLGFEVQVYEEGRLVQRSAFATLDEAEVFAEEWSDRVPGARVEIETSSHDHDTWELVEDDTAVAEDYPRDV